MMPRDDAIIGDWKKIRNKVKARWHAFNDEDLNAINGSRAQLVSLVQLHYGLPIDRAEADVDEFLEETESSR